MGSIQVLSRSGVVLLISFVAFLSSVLVDGANREEVLVQNADDSIWALNGDSVRLVCRHSRTSLGQWFRRWPNGTETQLQTMIATTTNVGSVLSLTMSQSLNGSSYRCRLAAVDLSPVFASGQNRLLLGDEIKMNCTNEMTSCVKVGETLKKRCVITGLPEPNVTISKITETALSRRLPTADLSGLTFNDVALTDRGTYRVTAKNILQENETIVNVATDSDICESPVAGNLPVSVSVNCYTSASVDFTAKGIPAPQITSGRATVGATTVSKDTDGITSVVKTTLEIMDIRVSDNNTKICATANNGIPPTSEECFQLDITCEPPGFVYVIVNETDTSALVFVTPRNEGDSITAYIYNLATVDDNVIIASQNVTNLSMPIPITNLTPNTSYRISVAAVNRVGRGPFTPNEFKTDGKPDETTASLMSSTCSAMTLDYEPANDNGAPIEAYFVLYINIQIELSLTIEDDDTKSPVTITGLNESTTYTLSIWSVNIYGISRLSKKIVATTPPCDKEKSRGGTIGAGIGSTIAAVTVVIIISVVVVKKKKRRHCGTGSSHESQGIDGNKTKKPRDPIHVPHDVKVAEAQYAETGPDLTGKAPSSDDNRYTGSGGPIPGTVNNPSPKEVKHKKGPAGDNYAMLEKELKDSYATPDVTKKRKAQKEVYAELDHEESGQAAAKPSPKVADKNEKTIYADMNPEQPKPRDH